MDTYTSLVEGTVQDPHNRAAHKTNKAYLRDQIAATGLVMLLKSARNRRFLDACDVRHLMDYIEKQKGPLPCS